LIAGLYINIILLTMNFIDTVLGNTRFKATTKKQAYDNVLTELATLQQNYANQEKIDIVTKCFKLSTKSVISMEPGYDELTQFNKCVSKSIHINQYMGSLALPNTDPQDIANEYASFLRSHKLI
jgi:hypothetical protein